MLALRPSIQLGHRYEVDAALPVGLLCLECVGSLIGGHPTAAIIFQAIANAFCGAISCEDGAVFELLAGTLRIAHPIITQLNQRRLAG